MENEDTFNPAAHDPAKVPLDWMPAEQLEIVEQVPGKKGDGHVTTPVTHTGYGAAWWVTLLLAFGLIMRLSRSF